MILARCQTISMSCRAAWKTFSDALVGHQVEERLEIDAGRQRIDHHRLVGLAICATQSSG